MLTARMVIISTKAQAIFVEPYSRIKSMFEIKSETLESIYVLALKPFLKQFFNFLCVSAVREVYGIYAPALIPELNQFINSQPNYNEVGWNWTYHFTSSSNSKFLFPFEVPRAEVDPADQSLCKNL